MKAKFIGNNEAIIINGYKVCDPENLELEEFRLIKPHFKFMKTAEIIRENLKISVYRGGRTKIAGKWVLPKKEAEYGKDGKYRKTRISLSIC